MIYKLFFERIKKMKNWRKEYKRLQDKYTHMRFDDAYECVYEYNTQVHACLYFASYYEIGINRHDSEYTQLQQLDNYLNNF